MKKALLLLLLCSFAICKTPLEYAREVETSVSSDSVNFPFVKAYADKAMNGALQRAFHELRKKGHADFANQTEREWKNLFNETLWEERNIGDHKGISQWVTEKYRQIELFLGKDTCRLLHISDILTLNCSNVTVKPCTFPMDGVSGDRMTEYVRHFAGGPKGDDYFYGTIPVITYWFVNISLTAAGVPIVSSLVASVAERLMGIAAVGLGEKVYTKSCGGE